MAIAQKIRHLETELVDRDFSKRRKAGKKTIKVSLNSKRTLLNMINKTSRHNQLIRVGKTWGNRALEMKWRRENPDWKEKRIERRKQNDRAVGPEAARWDKHWSVKDADESSSGGEAVKSVKDIKVHPTILLKDMVEKKGTDIPLVRGTVQKRIGFIKHPANENQRRLDGKLVEDSIHETARSDSSSRRKRKISRGSRKKKRKKMKATVSKGHRKAKRKRQELEVSDRNEPSTNASPRAKKKKNSRSPSLTLLNKRIKLLTQKNKRKKEKNHRLRGSEDLPLRDSSSKSFHDSASSFPSKRSNSDHNIVTKRSKSYDLSSHSESKKRQNSRKSSAQSRSSSRSKSGSEHLNTNSLSKRSRKRKLKRRTFLNKEELKRPCGVSSDDNAYNADEESERGEENLRKNIGRSRKVKRRRSSNKRKRRRNVSKLLDSSSEDESISSSSSQSSREDFSTSRTNRKKSNLPLKRKEFKKGRRKSFPSLVAYAGQWTKIEDEYLLSGSDDSKKGKYDKRGNFIPRKKKSYREKLEGLRAKVLANARSAAADHLSSVEDRIERTTRSPKNKHLGESDSDSDDESDGNRTRGRGRKSIRSRQGFKEGRRPRNNFNRPRLGVGGANYSITSITNLDLSTAKLEARRKKFCTMAADNL